MKKIRLIDIKDLQYKHEIFLQETPYVLTLMIYIIATLMLVSFLFCVFGKTEEVVYAKGQVRPLQNISIVKNIVSGEILKINYASNQKIAKGQELLKIDDGIYVERKNALQTQYDEVNKKIEELDKLIKSYYTDKNLISNADTAASIRFDVYSNEKMMLIKRFNTVKKLWVDALEVPDFALAPARVRELKYQTDMAELDLIAYKNKFINTLRSEQESFLIEKENIYSELKTAAETLKNTAIISPVSGYVQEVSSLNVGDYIGAGETIVNIIPETSDKYKVEIQIKAKDIGKITKNMKIKYRFSAFPFHEFGGLTGEVTGIEPDSFLAKDGSVYFFVTGNLNNNILRDKEKKEYLVKPGFEVTAQIILKEQSILWYFLRIMDLTW